MKGPRNGLKGLVSPFNKSIFFRINPYLYFMKQAFDTQLEIFLGLLNNMTADYSIQTAQRGKKYVKIISTTKTQNQRSVYCFVDILTGDLLKAATWSAPAKHARGNIYNKNLLDGCEKYGLIYLR